MAKKSEPKLVKMRHESGAIVSVAEEKVERLGGSFERVTAAKRAAKKPE